MLAIGNVPGSDNSMNTHTQRVSMATKFANLVSDVCIGEGKRNVRMQGTFMVATDTQTGIFTKREYVRGFRSRQREREREIGKCFI